MKGCQCYFRPFIEALQAFQKGSPTAVGLVLSRMDPSKGWPLLRWSLGHARLLYRVATIELGLLPREWLQLCSLWRRCWTLAGAHSRFQSVDARGGQVHLHEHIYHCLYGCMRRLQNLHHRELRSVLLLWGWAPWSPHRPLGATSGSCPNGLNFISALTRS